VFWIVLFAMIMRIAADGYGFALLALQRDRAIAVVAVLSAVTSATATAVLTSLFGLWGAAVAFAVSAPAIFIVRYWLTTFNGWPTPPSALPQEAGEGARGRGRPASGPGAPAGAAAAARRASAHHVRRRPGAGAAPGGEPAGRHAGGHRGPVFHRER